MARTETRNAVVSWLIIFGFWAVLHGALAVTVASPVFEGQLPGPDEYMRLVRVAELRDGNGWYDTVIARSNAPYGEVLHWTRPMDMLILAGAYALSPFLNAHDALFGAGALVSPVLDLLICAAVAWAAIPLIGRERTILAVVIVLIQPGVLAYTAAGRSDHHGLLFLLFALAVGGTLRSLTPRVTPHAAVIAGVAYGIAVWESVEMTLAVAVCQAAAAIAWIRFEEVKARPLLTAAAAFLGTTVLALALEHSPSALFEVELDRLSLPYVVIAALTCAVWVGARVLERRGHAAGMRQRAILIGATGIPGVVILLAVFPNIIAGPLATIDPRIVPLWIAHIAENSTLVPTDIDTAGRFLFFIGFVAPSFAYAAIKAWRQKDGAHSAPWMLMTLVLAVYFLMSLQHIRVAPFAEIASAPVPADMIGRLVDWSERRLSGIGGLLVTCGGVFVLMFGSVIAGAYLLSLSAAASSGALGPSCRIARIAPLLNDPAKLGARPLIIAALLDRGPELLYRTKHSVVATPYHRNGAGIWNDYRLFAASEEDESRKIVTRRGIDLLLICPTAAERAFFTHDSGRNSLYTRLIDGDAPRWLVPVAADPENREGFRLYRVIR